MALCSQRWYWNEFRAWQVRVRLLFPDRPFSDYVDEVRDRRRRHGLTGGAPYPLEDTKRQLLRNWIEFQDYNLQLQERWQNARDETKKELEDARANPPRDVPTLEYSLGVNESYLEESGVPLRWSEEQRLVITAYISVAGRMKQGLRQAILTAIMLPVSVTLAERVVPWTGILASGPVDVRESTTFLVARTTVYVVINLGLISLAVFLSGLLFGPNGRPTRWLSDNYV